MIKKWYTQLRANVSTYRLDVYASMSDGWQITLRPRPDTRIRVFLKLEIVNNWRFLKSPAFCLRVDGRKQWSHTSSVLLQSWTKHMENLDTPTPPPPISPGSKIIKWRVLASARLHPWFFWGVGVCCSIFFCPRLLLNAHPVRDAIIFPSIALPFSYGWAKTIQIHYVSTGIWKEGENQSLEEADFRKNKTL